MLYSIPSAPEPLARRHLRVFALALAGAALAWPQPVPAAASRLDDFLPGYQFREVHSAVIDATPARVWSAIRQVTAGEVRGLPQVLWMNPPWQPLSAREKALSRRPVLDVAARRGFVVLADAAPQEMVVGTIGQFWRGHSLALRSPDQFRAFRRPGFARMAVNCRVVPLRDGRSRVITETRAAATDAASRPRFDAYWRAAHPGGALLRREWMSAVERRAEAPLRTAAAPRAAAARRR